MSLASYIGCFVEIPITPEKEQLEVLFFVDDCFSGEKEKESVKKHQFTTPYVYEVSSHWGIEITKHMNQETCEESKKKLIALCEMMNHYLKEGDYFELFSCWVGEERDEREGEITLKLGELNIDNLEIPEKTYLRIYK